MKSGSELRRIAASLAIALTVLAGALPSRSDGVQANLTINRNHRTGIAGRVYWSPLSGDKSPYAATLDVYTKRNNHIYRIGQIDTAGDGTFYVALPPGIYALKADLPSGLSADVVVVRVQLYRLTLAEIDVSPDF